MPGPLILGLVLVLMDRGAGRGAGSWCMAISLNQANRATAFFVACAGVPGLNALRSIFHAGRTMIFPASHLHLTSILPPRGKRAALYKRDCLADARQSSVDEPDGNCNQGDGNVFDNSEHRDYGCNHARRDRPSTAVVVYNRWRRRHRRQPKDRPYGDS
ncbi:MAG: hypothetical protein M1826_003597 [Phylliscum demangeonii]|nr:MAG: hypothetical protein M1826_003597 [Phylliscum demangeonii]